MSTKVNCKICGYPMQTTSQSCPGCKTPTGFASSGETSSTENESLVSPKLKSPQQTPQKGSPAKLPPPSSPDAPNKNSLRGRPSPIAIPSTERSSFLEQMNDTSPISKSLPNFPPPRPPPSYKTSSGDLLPKSDSPNNSSIKSSPIEDKKNKSNDPKGILIKELEQLKDKEKDSDKKEKDSDRKYEERDSDHKYKEEKKH